MEVHERLKGERERLGLTQPLVAKQLGVGKTTVINWEKGVSAPDALQLAVFAELGADVSYVITGQRSQPVRAEDTLPQGDRILLDNFHAAPAQVQSGVRTTLGAFAASAGQVKSRKRAA